MNFIHNLLDEENNRMGNDLYLEIEYLGAVFELCIKVFTTFTIFNLIK